MLEDGDEAWLSLARTTADLLDHATGDPAATDIERGRLTTRHLAALDALGRRLTNRPEDGLSLVELLNSIPLDDELEAG